MVPKYVVWLWPKLWSSSGDCEGLFGLTSEIWSHCHFPEWSTHLATDLTEIFDCTEAYCSWDRIRRMRRGSASEVWPRPKLKNENEKNTKNKTKSNEKATKSDETKVRHGLKKLSYKGWMITAQCCKCFFKWTIPGLFYRLFLAFSNKLYNFYNNILKKCPGFKPMISWTWVSSHNH